jgi:2-phospho-L-lactate guanylyltransferase (CobY/MobA/RfbA family)
MIAALVPAKALDRAKGRLAALLTEEERRQLALMLETEERCRRCRIESVAVIIPTPSAGGRRPGANHRRAASVRVNRALAWLSVCDEPPRPCSSYLPTSPPSTGRCCQYWTHCRRAAAYRPLSRAQRAGTLKPNVIPFGSVSNRSSHKRKPAAWIEHTIVRNDALANDIDEPADLKRFLEHPAETATHRLLARLGVAGRLA